MRYVLTIEYLGTNYNGWQRQQNAVGVQQVIEDKLCIVLQQKAVLVASGRTDTGVHAKGQVAHFDVDKEINTRKVMYSLNSLLPKDIRIPKCEKASDDFHAQYSAKRKTYRYSTYVSEISSPLKDLFAVQIVPPFDIEKVKRASKKLVGIHDFRAFSSTGSSIKGTVRELYRADVIQKDNDVIFEFEGNGFLYNMVRIIVGTLVFIGKGKIPEDNLDRMLSEGIRKLGGKTYPPEGLCLMEVKYN